MAGESVLHPSLIVPVGHVEPVPRRLRGMVAGRVVFDTRRAVYVWEWRAYPQFSIPLEDLVEGVLSDDDHAEEFGAGRARRHSLRVGDTLREGAAWIWEDGVPEGLRGTVRFEWDSLDSWFEEDEPVFVHPRSPYSRIDALRSSSSVRVDVDGLTLADAPHCVKLFETGLPTRYYLDRMYVDWPLLRRTENVTRCAYKGTTSGYWSFDSEIATHENILWGYDFPTVQATAVAGMVAFYNEHVDLYVDGELLRRPTGTPGVPTLRPGTPARGRPGPPPGADPGP
ncbi:DUF427 domain-containing protein [Streptomyces sp. NPDC086080]|uniref:DUF427 domain-containing protein n=1 Tax=Streptomyces sp. NPDC086080 TaxID=3365748 RepID=UPI0037D6645F